MNQDSQVHSKKKILVGMTGRVDSTVAAYLLKKQGYEVVGIGILFGEEGRKVEVDPKTGKEIRPFGVQFINDINLVKGVCDELDIEFYGVQAYDRYCAKVEEFLVAARLSGTTYSPLVYSTRLIVETLVDKMKSLGADGVATGNYGKISIDPRTGSISLGQSNDLANDESFQMARIRPRDAVHLNLPLSEMRRKEVLKIYDSLKLKNRISVEETQGDKVNELIIMEDPRVQKIVEEKSPKKLRREGSITNYMEDNFICDHEGVHKYFIGQKKVKGKNNSSVDSKLQVVKIDPAIGDILVAPEDELRFSFCELRNFSMGKGKNASMPLSAYVKFRPDLLKVSCNLYLGNNESAILEFGEEQKGQLVSGQFVVLYDREGEGARVVGAGIVNRSGYLDKDGSRRVLPKNNYEKMDEDNDAPSYKPVPLKF